MDTLGPKEEDRFLTHVKTAVSLVDEQGLSPTDAIEKVAREEAYGPGMIRTLGRTYNTGRQLGQWQTGSSIMDKLAEFPLADPEEVIKRIYPDKAATMKEASDAKAFAGEYLFPPSWVPDEDAMALSRRDLPVMEKAAALISEAEVRDRGERSLRKRFGQHERLKKAYENARAYASGCYDNLCFHVDDLVDYFKQANYNRLPFAQVEHACRTYYQDSVGDLLKLAYERAKLDRFKEKTAADVKCQTRPFDRTAEPFTIIDRVVKVANELLTARQWAKEAEAVYQTFGEADLLPFDRPSSGATKAASSRLTTSTSPSLLDGCSEKRGMGLATEIGAIAAGDILGGTYLHHAGLEGPKSEETDPVIENAVDERNNLIDRIRQASAAARGIKAGEDTSLIKGAFLSSAAVGGALATTLNRGLGDFPKTKGDLIEDAWLELEDPEHLNELRKIKSHAMLNTILTDPEDPIASHNAGKVIDRFNEIGQLAPRTAETPAALKPLLRKGLTGHTEPFEVKELTDIEKGLAQTRAPTPNTRSLLDAPDTVLG